MLPDTLYIHTWRHIGWGTTLDSSSAFNRQNCSYACTIERHVVEVSRAPSSRRFSFPFSSSPSPSTTFPPLPSTPCLWSQGKSTWIRELSFSGTVFIRLSLVNGIRVRTRVRLKTKIKESREIRSRRRVLFASQLMFTWSCIYVTKHSWVFLTWQALDRESRIDTLIEIRVLCLRKKAKTRWKAIVRERMRLRERYFCFAFNFGKHFSGGALPYSTTSHPIAPIA